MRYTVETDINLPVNEVMELLVDMDFMKEWQEGLVKTEQLTGTAHEEGSMFKHYFDLGDGKRTVMTETLMKIDPEHHEFDLLFETGKMKNYNMNYFIEEGEHTKWICKNRNKYKGMRRLTAPFVKGPERRHRINELETFATCAAEKMHHHQ